METFITYTGFVLLSIALVVFIILLIKKKMLMDGGMDNDQANKALKKYTTLDLILAVSGLIFMGVGFIVTFS